VRRTTFTKIKALGDRLRAGAEEEKDGADLAREELDQARRQLARRREEVRELKLLLEREAGSRRAAAEALAREGAAPFFVLGPPKSGTSWLQATLNSHPEILCSGEGKFFGRNLKADNPYGQWGREFSAAMTGLGDAEAGRPSLHSAIADSKDLAAWFRRNGGWTENGEIGLHKRALVRLTLDYVFAEARARSGKPFVGDKTPSHVQYLDEIFEFYPDARIIHIVRDGRDQAVSSIFHWWRQAKDRGGFFPLSPALQRRRDAYYEDPGRFGPGKESIFDEDALRALARNWRDVVSDVHQKGPRLYADRYFEVRYEDLLARPVELFAGMVTFLGGDADPETIEKIVGENSFESRTGDRALGTEDPKSFLRKGISGDWKNHFTERDRRAYAEEAGDLLVELGYERDDSW
jgi:Sulfotransferase family